VQLLKEIQAKLLKSNYEQALVYLKEFVSEKKFAKPDFILRALKNDVISDKLLSELSIVYSKLNKKYSASEMTKLSLIDLHPISARIRFV
jgi:hypothetical protein